MFGERDPYPKLSFDDPCYVPEIVSVNEPLYDVVSVDESGEPIDDHVSSEYWERLTSAIKDAPLLPDDDYSMDPEPSAEITQLLSLVYDDVDTGEEPEAVNVGEEFDSQTLKRAIENYVPVNPMLIDVTGDISYSGSPTAELIDESPLISSLEALKINIPEALLRTGLNTVSTKKTLYE